MQAAQRAEWNHALEFAAAQANDLGRPLVVFFGLTADFPEANERHYAFMLEGLAETAHTLGERGIPMVVRKGSPADGIADIGRRAALVVVDDGVLRVERRWRAEAAGRLACPLVQVETNVVVPVATASAKEEYSAATLRAKILPRLDAFLVPLRHPALRKRGFKPDMEGVDLRRPDAVMAGLDLDRSAGRVTGVRGGGSEARRRLMEFVETKLARYAVDRNDPSLDTVSGLSPYLHFGQISPLEVALAAMKGPRHGRAAFLEELIVRRELAVNFVRFNGGYDRFAGLPAWARGTLLSHAADPREFRYGREDFERARTHDPYWNAAQREMVLTGRMHGYMRMYWGKKILEWSASPRQAFRTALALNNRYELDGRDPNGFAGVAWCFGKHDRPWGGRPVYGIVRSMTAGGLRRKFNIDAYVARVSGLAPAGSGNIPAQGG
jgi:deoxyribodipyrimidine photo-lyase